MPQEEKTFKVEDARLLFANFSGDAKPFNAAGERNFCVILDANSAQRMAKDGWNVKQLKDQDDEGTPGDFYIKVKVSYKIKPPKVVMITSSGRTMLSQELVGMLDWADIRTVDLIARAYEYTTPERSGIAAYLKTMFVTLNEDELEMKYAMRESG